MKKLALTIALAACGAAPHSSEALQAELAESGLTEAREVAPDLVALAEQALAAAREAERVGDTESASDWITASRLYADAALSERERASADRERIALEREALAAEEQAIDLEAQARNLESIGRRRAAIATLEEELARAEERAIEDEANTTRRRRHSLGDDASIRRAAQTLADRARLLGAAARALGVSAEDLDQRVLEVLSAASNAPPHDALVRAEEAHRAARALLGQARRGLPAHREEERATLLEASAAARLSATRTERGLVFELSAAFRGDALNPSLRAKVTALARLLTAHPHGTLLVEASNAAREEVLRALLEANGIEAQRLSVSGGALTSDAANLVLPAY